MNAAINELVKSIVKKNSLSECSVSELQRLTTQYPYFGPVQFLLAQKLKEDNSPLYQKQSQKAILYFHDHLWFDYLSGSANNNTVIISAVKPEPIPAEPAEIISPSTVEPAPLEIHVVEEEKTTAPMEQEEIINNVYTEPNSHAEETAPVKQEEIINNVYTEPTTRTEETVLVEQEETIIEPFGSGELNSAQEETETETETLTGQQMPELPALKIEPLDAAAAKLVFEPYHTVDYFASQGIRFKEEEKPKDRFGQQLKSFTEWLKSMKRLPDAEAGALPATSDDPKVTQLAEHSIVDREVVTEAMAEVWEQQGNHEKAIETYRKLSLLNPSKSAYFAGKIEHLKHS